MPDEAYEALQAIAKKDRRVLAEVIRIALEQYAKDQGYKVSFDVERGGYRPRKSTTISEEK